MDNLKIINDRYGHAVGDKAIKGMVQAIKKKRDEFFVKKYIIMGIKYR